MQSTSTLIAATFISAAALCAALAGCDDSPPVESDTITVMDQAAVDQSATDQAVGDQAVADQTTVDTGSCPKSKPTGFCTAVGTGPCVYAQEKCRCESVCSGRKPPPGQEYSWNCQTVACPAAAPKDGATCSQEALKCTYSCTTATCTSSKWAVKTLTPP